MIRSALVPFRLNSAGSQTHVEIASYFEHSHDCLEAALRCV